MIFVLGICLSTVYGFVLNDGEEWGVGAKEQNKEKKERKEKERNEKKNKKNNKLLICKVSKLASMSVMLYFISTITLLFVSGFILVSCCRRCNKQKDAGGGPTPFCSVGGSARLGYLPGTTSASPLYE